ncbi:MAG: hypothetical protein WD073_08255 [Xanthobacteraceae bacterium]
MEVLGEGAALNDLLAPIFAIAAGCLGNAAQAAKSAQNQHVGATAPAPMSPLPASRQALVNGVKTVMVNETLMARG